MSEAMDLDQEPSPPARNEPSTAPSGDESGGEAEADLMVLSRPRRSKAGNRMAKLLAQAAEEHDGEEWGDEWEEAANEEDFVEGHVNEDEDNNLHSSSSSSSEDEGGDDDDDAGEKELQRAERAERKKRKSVAHPFAASRLAALAARKRVKLDVPTGAQPSPAPRPKKKSERASWIPTPEDGPIRMSARKQTVANKEHTLAKLKEKDRRRDDTLAMMKAAEARKAKDEPKALTQAERLAEAARVERVNSKSLHRWEEAEELRAAERQAKIDALKNRQIEGPFIRFWSGPAIWVDDKLKYTGKDAPKVEDLDEKLNKEIDAVLEGRAPPSSLQSQSNASPQSQSQSQTQTQNPEPSPSHPSQGPPHQTESPSTRPSSMQPPPSQASQAPVPVTMQPPTSQASQTPAPQAVQTPPKPFAIHPSTAAHTHPTSSHDMQYPSTIMFPPPQASNGGFLSGIEHYANGQQDPPQQQQNSQQQPPSSTSPAVQPQSQQQAPQAQPPIQQHPPHSQPQQPQQQPPYPHPHPPAQPQFQPQQAQSGYLPPSTLPPQPQPQQQQPPPHFAPNSWSPNPTQSPFSQPHPSLSDPALANHTNMNPTALLQQFQRPPPPPPPPAPPRRKVIRKALRNLLMLHAFPNLELSNTQPSRSRTTISSLKEKDRQTLIHLSSTLFGWSEKDATTFVTSMLTAPKSKRERESAAAAGRAKKEVCAVTNRLARYRDPGTGIAYADLKAFKVLRGVVSGEYVWSGALGCYVGAKPTGSAPGGASGTASGKGHGVEPVRGVPRRFWDPNAPAPVKVAPPPPSAPPALPGVQAGASGPAAPQGPAPPGMAPTPTPAPAPAAHIQTPVIGTPAPAPSGGPPVKMESANTPIPPAVPASASSSSSSGPQLYK